MNAREDPNIDDLDWRPLSAELMVLVCRQCRKRRDGPKHLKAKDLASTFRVATKSRRLKARTLLTSCQGLCPKDATSWSRSLEGSRWARHVPLDRSMWSKASLLRPRSPARTVPARHVFTDQRSIDPVDCPRIDKHEGLCHAGC